MAARGAEGDSKFGLIITIIFLVILVIGLGVWCYFLYDGQKELIDKATAADSDKTSMQNSRDWEEFKGLLVKAYIGLASKEDLGLLANERAKFEGNTLGQNEKDHDAVRDMIKKLDDKDWDPDKKADEKNWDPTLKKPVTTFIEQVIALHKEVKDLKDNMDKAERDSSQTIADDKANLTKVQGENTDLRGKLDAAQKDYATVLDESKKKVDAFLAKAANDQKDQKDFIDKQQAEKEKALADVTKLTKSVTDLQKRVNKETKFEATPVERSLLAQGKIVSIDRKGTFAYIDLGSADNVQLQQTFSIFGVGADGKPDIKFVTNEKDINGKTFLPKGGLEVVNVIEPHLSMAKIVYRRDAFNDPVLGGDPIFNPDWNPTIKEHVAIAGLIDLTGDGADNTAEFVRDLEKHNIIVDAWLDPRDGTMKPEGGKLSYQTKYLVMGVPPSLDVLSSAKLIDVATKIGQMKEEADRLGITKISSGNYMGLIGLKVPKSTGGANYGLRPTRSGAETKPEQPAAPPEK